ncbi:MAG: amidohydrolase family protein [Actinomycetota bacterium]
MSQPPTTATILAGTLLDGRSSTPRPDMAVHVADGRIAAITPSSEVGPGADDVIDLRDHTIAPGFIDAHVHLVFAPCANHPATRALVEERSRDQLLLQGVANAMACLASGITTVRDCGDRDQITLPLRDAVAQGLLPGPRVLAAGMPITTSGGHLHWTGLRADDPMAARLAVRQLCEAGVDLVKVMASGGNMTAGSNPLAPQFDGDELRVIVEEAHRLGRPVAAHALNTAAIGHCLDAGVDTIEHCTWQQPDGSIDVDPVMLQKQVDNAVPAVITMAGIARLLLPGSTAGTDSERAQALHMSRTGTLAGDFAYAAAMRDAGAPVVIASDAGTRFTAFDGFADSIRCAMEALDIDLATVLPMVTFTAATALGIAEETGSVEVGKAADLVALQGHTSPGRRDVPPVLSVWRAGVRTPIQLPAVPTI